jgi:hypothetical protein
MAYERQDFAEDMAVPTVMKFPDDLGATSAISVKSPFMIYEIVDWNNATKSATGTVKGSASAALKSIEGSIVLPMPESGLVDNTSISWSEEQMAVSSTEDTDYMSYMWERLKARGANVLKNATGSLGAYYVQSRGATINDFTGLLFGGVDLRSYEFTYNLMPSSEGESKVLQQILYTFKKSSITTYDDTVVNFPKIFNIYVTMPRLKRELFEIKTCACTGVAINYDGDGRFNTFKNGFPIKVGLTLSFRELARIDRKDLVAP